MYITETSKSLFVSQAISFLCAGDMNEFIRHNIVSDVSERDMWHEHKDDSFCVFECVCMCCMHMWACLHICECACVRISLHLCMDMTLLISVTASFITALADGVWFWQEAKISVKNLTSRVAMGGWLVVLHCYTDPLGRLDTHYSIIDYIHCLSLNTLSSLFDSDAW